MQNTKNFITYILGMIEDYQISNKETVLPTNELRLKLVGAYERLEKIPNDQY